MTITPRALPAHVESLSPDVVPFDGAHWYELADANHFWMRWRLQEALRLLTRWGIRTEESARALDVGGGAGVVRGQFESRTAWTVDLAELDLTALRHAPSGRGRTLQYDVTQRQPELGGAYDLVLLFDVLEHIEETAPFLDALLWHLRPGGHLVINVPAIAAAHSRYDDAAGHVRRYSRAALRAELVSAGATTIATRHWGAGLVPALLARKAYLDTIGRNLGRDEVLQRGFGQPGRVGSALLETIATVERSLPRRAPIGTSLLLLAQKG